MSPAPLDAALDGERHWIGERPYRANLYEAGLGEPLLLIHSINAAPSAYEVKPIYDDLRGERRVYALELPGFGGADRSPLMSYDVALYVQAILAAVEAVKEATGRASIDVLGLSLTCEFLARAALRPPAAFRRLIFVSPTGFQRGSSRLRSAPGATRQVPLLERVLRVPAWRKGLFGALTTKRSIQFFLRRTFGSRAVDQGLIDYAYRTSHQADAEFAPWAFASGKLFSKDIRSIYEAIELPVWLVHGTKGAFSDFSEAAWTNERSNWQTAVFETGAFPQFQERERFMACLRQTLLEPISAR